jgi:outer membrane lipoprotein-sorting protein
MLRFLAILIYLGALTSYGAESSQLSAKDFAARLSSLRDGTSYTRLRLEIKQPVNTTGVVLQLQIKETRVNGANDVVYQVLWPKERKGEGVLLHQAGSSSPTCTLFVLPDKMRTLSGSQLAEDLFGSDLSYEDVIEDFFAWQNQTIAGNEVINGVNCVVLESKPDKADSSGYAVIRSWIDPRRFVPLRVEKYASGGKLVRRIDTTRVVTDDKGRSIPGGLIVHSSRADSLTDLDGSRIKHDVSYSANDFTAQGLRDLSVPSGP